jgi:hypothetical protein
MNHILLISAFFLLSVFGMIPAGISLAAEEAAETETPAPEETAAPAEEPAAEEAVPAAEEDPEVLKRREAAEQASGMAYEKMGELLATLGPNQQKHFYLLYTNHNIISTVKVVQNDIGKAIKQCGENNPEMKEKLDAKHKEWDDTINPVLKDAEANIGNMIIAQEYAKEKEIKEILKMVDKAREKNNSQIEKIPVTTPEACEYLIGKMDETREGMKGMLSTTLITFPQAFPEGTAEDKAIAEKAAEEASEVAEEEAEKAAEQAKEAEEKAAEETPEKAE